MAVIPPEATWLAYSSGYWYEVPDGTVLFQQGDAEPVLHYEKSVFYRRSGRGTAVYPGDDQLPAYVPVARAAARRAA